MDTTGLHETLTELDFEGVVLLQRGDDVLFGGAYGLASRRWNVPHTLDTRFDTASITKLFTSVAVLQQVEKGALDLDASIHDTVDLAGTKIPREVTLRHLLTHTSGIADDADEEAGEDYAELWVDKPSYSVIETHDFLPQFAHKEPRVAPGTDCRYCNVGYVLAGLALESVTGQSYRDYVRAHVFARAGMTESDFFDRRDAAPRVAEGGDVDEDGKWVQNLFSYPPIGSPDGGAHSTAGDLIRFFAAARGGQLLGEEWTTRFFEPQVRHDEDTEYGFGLEFSELGYYKDGINAGASGVLIHYTGADVDAVVLSNSEDGAWDAVSELNERAEAAAS
ncbi:serine hydrolase domain-containing protein [Microbacterium sp.]|uniref:serine hydrolase domain-containing protein n=1 Tax=Microbacterium sp. TaxID=51671 RepID=UPI0039E56AD4